MRGSTGGAVVASILAACRALSDELAGKHPVVPVTLLGEKLVLFCDESGALGLIGRHCPHRGTDMCNGRLEDNGLRCPFHGWHFDVSGQCVEQPADPEGSKMHEHIKTPAYPLVDQTGTNLFMPAQGENLSPVGEQWIAGLLKHAAASCLLSTPTINGYKRYQPYSLAPDRIQWGFDNRGAVLRVLARSGDPASRVENPYASDAPLLPASFIEALQEFESSPFYQQALGKDFVSYLPHIKHAEWQRF